MKGPTKDYRPFRGDYGGRGYRVMRLTLNTALQLLKRRSSIIILVLSSLFVFINVIALALAPEQGMSIEELDVTEEGAFFEVIPVGEDDLLRMVDLGTVVEMEYYVRNAGKETGEALVAFVPPSQYWSGEVRGNSTITLAPGQEMKVTIEVDVPPDQSGFDYISDIIGSENGRPGFYYQRRGEQVVSVVASSMESLEELYAKFQEKDVVPTEMDLSSLSDPRMGITSSLMVLRTRERVIHWEPYMTVTEPAPATNLSFVTADGSFIRTIEVKQNEYLERGVKFRNDGGSEVIAELFIFWNPLQYMPAYIDPMDNPSRRLDPGQQADSRFALNTGQYPMNKAVNFLVIVKDGETHSNVTMIELNYFTRVKSDNEKLGRQYYDMLWGGGMRYERFLWLVLFLAISGAALISDDLKNNSIALYLSRPISWVDYIIGKSAGLLIALTPISILPAIILYITGIAFSDRDLGEVLDTVWLLGAIVLTYLLTLMVMVSVSVALSSVSRKWIYAGVGTFSVFIFSSIISTILRAIFDQDWLKLLDLRLLMKLMFRPLFAIPYDPAGIGFDWYLTLLVMVGVVVACVAMVFYKFHNREVAR